MTFAVPLFLLASMAGIIPVILHMISSRRAPEVRFSTLRFLRVSVQRTRRRKRVHDLLLMLVRIAALVLVAIGLAKPALTSLSSILGGKATSAVVIVLDNSASMSLIDEGRLRFETATRAAERILDEVRDGDAVALLLTGGPVLPEQGRLYHTHEAVREMLAQSRTSFERADLAAKLAQARQLLAESDAPNQEIYVITDCQATSWEGLKEHSEDKPRPADSESTRRDVPLILVDVHRQAAPNVALRNLQIDTPVRAVGVPVVATVELFNASSVPQQQHVELYLDGTREAASPTLSIPPLSSVKQEFRFTSQTAGVRRGEVRLGSEDASPLDNRLFFSLTIDQQIPVAVVKPRRHEIAYLDDAFYLEQALAPADGSGWAIRPTSLVAADLATEQLANYAVVFCVNISALEGGAIDRLRDYVASGGHIVWICGDNVQPDAYNRMNAAANDRLLPARLTEMRTAEARGAGFQSADATEIGQLGTPAQTDESRHIGYLDPDHAALAKLTDPASVYQSVLIHKHVCMSVSGPADESAAARVLARLDDGEPLLVERPVGPGKVLMLGTGIRLEWANLPLKPLFLPLFARLTFYLASAEADQSQALAGAPLTVPLSGSSGPMHVEIVRPGGESLRVPVDDEGSKSFRYADTHQVGVYVFQPIGVGAHKQFAFAVNPDPDESDPATIAAGDLKSHFGRMFVVCENAQNITATIRTLRQGESLWELFLSAVLVALVLESFLANRLRGRPVEHISLRLRAR